MYDGIESSPRLVAASVRKTARLRLAESELAQTKDRLASIASQIRALTTAPDDRHADTLRALDGERRALADAIGPIRRRVVVLRGERAAVVRKVLGPVVATAAARACAALEALQEAVGTLNAVNVELQNASGEVYWLPAVDLTTLGARLRRLSEFN